MTLAINVPEAVAVMLVGFVVGVVVSNFIVTVPPAMNPEPVTVIVVPGDPLLAESVIDGWTTE
jgi:hypothetical protein